MPKINWKKRASSNYRLRSYAWAMYFSEVEAGLENNLYYLSQLSSVRNDEKQNKTLTPFLESMIQKLYLKAKEKTDCCICLDTIQSIDLKPHFCGHIFHKECWKAYEASHIGDGKKIKCPLCRAD